MKKKTTTYKTRKKGRGEGGTKEERKKPTNKERNKQEYNLHLLTVYVLSLQNTLRLLDI